MAFTHNVIHDSQSNDTCQGGGLFLIGPITLNHALFFNNRADCIYGNGSYGDNEGGGIYIKNSGVTLNHITFSSNFAEKGKGFFVKSGANPSIKNPLLNHDTANGFTVNATDGNIEKSFADSHFININDRCD